MSADMDKRPPREQNSSWLRTTGLDIEMNLRINAQEIAEIQSLGESQPGFKSQLCQLYGDLGQITSHLGLNFLICKVR